MMAVVIGRIGDVGDTTPKPSSTSRDARRSACNSPSSACCRLATMGQRTYQDFGFGAIVLDPVRGLTSFRQSIAGGSIR